MEVCVGPGIRRTRRWEGVEAQGWLLSSIPPSKKSAGRQEMRSVTGPPPSFDHHLPWAANRRWGTATHRPSPAIPQPKSSGCPDREEDKHKKVCHAHRRIRQRAPVRCPERTYTVPAIHSCAAGKSSPYPTGVSLEHDKVFVSGDLLPEAVCHFYSGLPRTRAPRASHDTEQHPDACPKQRPG